MTTSIQPTVEGQALLSKAAFRAILALVFVADALDMLDATITNVAAPSIVHDLGGGAALFKWLGAAYALSLGVLLVVGGRLGDKYGQRRLFMLGMAGFTVASAACAGAPDPTLMIIARACQGAFGALLIPQGMAIMTRAFTKEQLRTAFNLFAPVVGLATMGGPILAGFVINLDIAGLSWRPVFWINVVIGAAGLIAANRVLPRQPGDPTVVVDVTGSALLGFAMFGLFFGLVEGSTDGWGLVPSAAIATGTLLLAWFAYHQRTATNPLLKPSLLANRGFTSGMVTGLVFFAAIAGLEYVISLFIQQALGASPGATALGLLPMTIGIMVSAGGSMALGLNDKLGRNLVTVGILTTTLGVAGLLAIVLTQGAETELLVLAAPIFICGLGMGACFGTIFSFALGDVEPDEAGGASGAVSAMQQLATGIGSAVITTVYFASADQTSSMKAALIVVLAATAACLPAVRLLPTTAAPDPETQALA